jgi:hypothetical protein
VNNPRYGVGQEGRYGHTLFSVLTTLWEKDRTITAKEAAPHIKDAILGENPKLKNEDYLDVVVLYWAQNHLNILNRQEPKSRPKPINLDGALASWLRAAILPSGKTLLQSTGAELVKLGGQYTRLGKKVGPRNVAGKKFSVKEIVAIWKAKQ